MTGKHNLIALQAAACTSCMICVRECPTWCIELDSHSVQVQEGRRSRTLNVLDDFRIDFSLCMHCGTCIDVCPTDALSWSGRTDASAPDRAGLRHDTAMLESHREDPAC